MSLGCLHRNWWFFDALNKFHDAGKWEQELRSLNKDSAVSVKETTGRDDAESRWRQGTRTSWFLLLLLLFLFRQQTKNGVVYKSIYLQQAHSVFSSSRRSKFTPHGLQHSECQIRQEKKTFLVPCHSEHAKYAKQAKKNKGCKREAPH